ncbi:sperm-associated microtubule inner protein 4 [Lissotriton helveticus]
MRSVMYEMPYYYREREGADSLSRTLQSTELLTPLDLPPRPTVSLERYDEYLQNTPANPRLPWGREREYGGIGPVSLPDDHRPKREPPPSVAKGHKHYGYGGDPSPGGVPVESYYDLTQLKRSAVRQSDDLLPKPPDASMTTKQIYQRFPGEHPYQSHISKFAMFPSYRSPDDPDIGVRASSAPPLHPHTPASSYDAIVLRKTSGNPYRHEVIKIPSDSQRKSVHWPGQEGYFHIPKFDQENQQVYYPKPPKTMLPNATLRPWEETLSRRSANVLRNLEKAQWLTTYNQSFTGRGSMNPLQLDDLHEKLIGNLTGEVDDNAELKEQYLSPFLSARPLEGRNARLLQDRRPLELPDWNSTYENPQEKGFVSATDIHLPRYLEEQAQVNSNALTSWNLNHSDPCEKCKKMRSEALHYMPHDGMCSEHQNAQFYPQQHHQDNNLFSNKSHEINKTHKALEFQKITDTCANEALYQRQITESPVSPEPLPKPVSYEDLPPSKLDYYTVGLNPFSLSRPMMNGDSSGHRIQLPKSLVNPWDLVSATPRARTAPYTNAQARPHIATTLQELQDSYSKSEAHKIQHQMYPEKPKDLRDNYYSGKRHTFFGINSSYFN